jgi:aerobic-type carbon monoxide dehydrogenase small subunit (CoxS/CutS family)
MDAMARYALIVNDDEHVIDANADTPLLWALRDSLGLCGTKYGCGEGLCGACTVLIDGQAVRSCVTTVDKAVGSRIVTIEGLSDDGSHPVQQAWLAESVSQCGFCQPGQILAAVALLERSNSPTDEDIDRALEGNLCRCGTYARIRRAIHRVARGEVG